MRFTVASLSVALVASTVSASPFHTRSQNAGALYFINNDESGNFVVVHDIKKDGTISFADVIRADGVGEHGLNVPPPQIPDPLFSQGSVTVSGKHLFTVNAGSNTVVMFSIDPTQPSKLSMVGRPVSSGGDFPSSITVSPKTGNVCVLNGGQNNAVQCFTADPFSGLHHIPSTYRALSVKQSTPPTGPGGSLSQVLFSDDGSKLIVAIKGLPPSTPGYLATFEVSPSGALSNTYTKATPAPGGLLPFGMMQIPGKDAFISTDPGAGFLIYDFSKGDNASSTVYPIPGQLATCWVRFSTKTGTFFMTDIGTSIATEVAVDKNLKGSIVKQYAFANGSATIDNSIATILGRDYNYILSPGLTMVDVLTLNGGPGKATHIQSYNFSADVTKAGAKINPLNLQGMASYVI